MIGQQKLQAGGAVLVRRNTGRMRSISFYVVISVLAILWITPVIFMVFTAIKSSQDLYTGGFFAIPRHIYWSNFSQAWTQGELGMYMWNSFKVSIIKVPLGIIIEALAAFSLTRMNLRFSRGIFIFFLIGLMIPIQVTLIPLSLMLTKYHLINTYFSLITIYIAFGLPFGMLVLRGFFRQIPVELDEAARIDGCSSLWIFFRIILPLSMPAIATLFILDFLATWNEFLLAQIFLTSDDMRTVPSGLLHFTTQYTANYPLLNAGVLISIIPVVVVYLLFQRYFVSGLGGSVKG